MVRSCLTLSLTLALAACATTAQAPAGMEAGKFVTFNCDKGAFQARWNPDAKSVRVRSHHGAAELTPAAEGSYSDDSFVLGTAGPDGISLAHEGKVLSKNCKKA